MTTRRIILCMEDQKLLQSTTLTNGTSIKIMAQSLSMKEHLFAEGNSSRMPGLFWKRKSLERNSTNDAFSLLVKIWRCCLEQAEQTRRRQSQYPCHSGCRKLSKLLELPSWMRIMNLNLSFLTGILFSLDGFVTNHWHSAFKNLYIQPYILNNQIFYLLQVGNHFDELGLTGTQIPQICPMMTQSFCFAVWLGFMVPRAPIRQGHLWPCHFNQFCRATFVLQKTIFRQFYLWNFFFF